MTDARTLGAIERYTELLGEMARLSGDQGYASSSRRWEQLVDQVREEEATLRESTEGRTAVSGLLDDPRPAVRLWAAGAALDWDEERARAVLSEIRESPTRYGLHSINAKHRMLEFDAEGRGPAPSSGA
jgi:hypothetical protein